MRHHFEYRLQIAGILILLQSDVRLLIEPKFQAFQMEDGCPDFIICFRQVKILPRIPEKVIYADMGYRVHQDDTGRFLRSFADLPRDDSIYAVASYDYAGSRIHVDYLQTGIHCVADMSKCFAHIFLEELLLCKKRLCLHASCVDTPMGGILFSGPSGIGKSTQSDLWCRHRGAKLINGDRPILVKDGDQWMAWGSPYAGSSRCHVNESCTIRAVVMLRQGPACSGRRLSTAEAFRKVWSGLTVHSWDAGFVNTACDLAQDFIESVPVYELTCTPDENAVICLEDLLGRECNL